MLPGEPVFKQCAHCPNAIAVSTILSGNTFGAVLWSDGKLDAPMLPFTPRLIACPYCQSLVWLAQLRKPNWKKLLMTHGIFMWDAKHYDEPTLDQYVAYLHAHTLDTNKERYVRQQIWWCHNDARRQTTHGIPLRADEQVNLTRLAELCNERMTDQRLMKAEVMRQLARFAAADALLTRIRNQEYADVVAQLRALVHAQNATLVQVH